MLSAMHGKPGQLEPGAEAGCQPQEETSALLHLSYSLLLILPLDSVSYAD